MWMRMQVYVCMRAREKGGESQYIVTCVCICVYVCMRVAVSMHVHSMYPRKSLGMCACLRDNDGDCVHAGEGRPVGPPQSKMPITTCKTPG